MTFQEFLEGLNWYEVYEGLSSSNQEEQRLSTMLVLMSHSQRIEFDSITWMDFFRANKN